MPNTSPPVYNEQHLLHTAIGAAIVAGERILEVYHSRRFRVRLKRDLSPVTLADMRAHEVITELLGSTAVPLLSEEGSKTDYKERRQWRLFWLVDPLDGTKEFIGRNDEFTVNIALVEDGVPVLGVVYAPVPDLLWFGTMKSGAFFSGGILKDIVTEIPGNSTPLPFPPATRPFRIVASRSHMNEATRRYIEENTGDHRDYELVSKGSSLKLCLIADGTADLYPRFGPTMEWDTAAGDAIIRASGGEILNTEDGMPLIYNKPNLRNPFFIARSRSAFGKADGVI